MISVIVCSVNPQLLEEIESNIAETIGTDYELLSYDNRQSNRGLCSICNEMARKAKGSTLCFVHEDYIFFSKGWGPILEAKTKEADTGVIGFGGSQEIHSLPYWYTPGFVVCYVEITKSGDLSIDRITDQQLHGFRRVAVLDGMFLCCAKEVWEKHPFDDKTFEGFHYYDMDFSFSVAQDYNNYVCFEIKSGHKSGGTLNNSYYNSLVRFAKKWEKVLPYSVNGKVQLQRRDRQKFIRKIIRTIYNHHSEKRNFSVLNFVKQIGLTPSLYFSLYAYFEVLRQEIKPYCYRLLRKDYEKLH